MARPEKLDDDKRELMIRLRVTSSEKSQIWQNAKNAGSTPSDFLRGLALNAKPSRTVPTPDRELLLKILAELNKNGSNLNQIARVHNRMREDGEPINISEHAMNSAIYGVDTLVKHLMEILGK
ncbi:plasmid mobilization protein [Mucilaginibacter paludis]|uniref:Mobilization protein n=1 Tax=Mucilaginibacter paludis DSM 18603 TaxID=714943 RepID=H1Y5M5_9SPHI|nr:plasmid mobilization relaxosome protein MobC [Mucilaginibacter paludis]EHQ29801.1 mobilization protein [Mucilaginibacter paludis DSM 18603]